MNKIVVEGYQGTKKEMMFCSPIEALKTKPKDFLSMIKNKQRFFMFGEGKLYTFDKEAFLAK